MDAFGITVLVVIVSVIFVSLQTAGILLLLKWNNELRSEVENLKPPF